MRSSIISYSVVIHMLYALVPLACRVLVYIRREKKAFSEKRCPTVCLFAGARKCETLFKRHLAEHHVVK